MTDSNQEFNELKAKLLAHLQKSLQQEPEFDEDGDIEKSYRFDDVGYVVQNETVFKLVDGERYVYTDEVTPNQLDLYGMELIDNSVIIELKILAIKEKENGAALITAEDGSGLEIVFTDEKYSQRKSNYSVGEIGIYNLAADVFDCAIPDDYAKGICLKGEDAERWFQWTEENEKIGLIDEVWTNLESAAVYSKTEDFDEDGMYNFYALVKDPAFVSFDEKPVYDKDGELMYDGFHLVLPNQFNKAHPRFITAFIAEGKFPPRIFQNLSEDKDAEFFSGGWAMKGKVKFFAESAAHTQGSCDEEEILRYGTNRSISFAELLELDNQDDYEN